MRDTAVAQWGRNTRLAQSESKPSKQQPTREESLDKADIVLSQRGRGDTFAILQQRRISRRGVLKAGLAAGAMVIVNPLTGKPNIGTALADKAQIVSGGVNDTPIAPQPRASQQVMVANGYSWAPFITWGDPTRAGAPAYDPTNLSAWAQGQQVGYNCDYIGYHALPFYDKQSRRGLLWINHEYTNGELMWADYQSEHPTREQADVEMAAHGGSVLEVIRGEDGRLAIDMYSPYNRRITATTPIRVSGPAAGHDWLKTQDDLAGAYVVDTLNNCAGGFTPWGTVLNCEENFQGYFGNLDLMDPEDPRAEVHARYGIEGGSSGYGWENHYGRFAVTNEPNEPFRYGWVVEVDPYDPESTPIKRTALGRFRHAGATFGYSPSGRIVFYRCLDNVNFDHAGNLWISPDGQPFPLGIAGGLYAVLTKGPQRGDAAQFLSVVAGAEFASFEFAHDHHNLVVSVQHPGEGGTVAEPVTAWPDGTSVPRPTVIQVWKDDGDRINS